MKIFYFCISIVVLTACQSQKVNMDNLPKDISLKPDRGNDKGVVDQAKDPLKLQAEMQNLRNEIFDLQSGQVCSGVEEIKIVPMGAKACGGPENYIGILASNEKNIAEKIEKYTFLVSEYNRITEAISDCSLVTPPTSAECVDGKIVLRYSTEVSKVVQ